MSPESTIHSLDIHEGAVGQPHHAADVDHRLAVERTMDVRIDALGILITHRSGDPIQIEDQS